MGRDGHDNASAWKLVRSIVGPVLSLSLVLPSATSAANPKPTPNLRPGPTAPLAAPKAAPPAATAPRDTIGTVVGNDDAAEAKAHDDAELPGDEAPPTAETRPTLDHPLGSAGLDLALKLIANGDFAGATLAAYALPNRVDVKIVDWLIAISGNAQVPSSRIADVSKRLADWPGQALLRLRYEQAIAREKPAAADVIKALGGTKPTSEEAAIVLARAYRDSDRKEDAAAVIRDLWARTGLSMAAEKTILAEFTDMLTPADHKARLDRLLYAGLSDSALRTSMQLDAEQQALAKAVVAVSKGQSTALKALDSLSAAAKKDPIAIYSRVQALRHANRYHDAATLLVDAPTDAKALVDPDAWWVERRLVSRVLIDAGDAKLAYKVAAGHSGESPAVRAEAEFHAGWYALQFLRDPTTAMKHFAAIGAASSAPLSASRSEYWLGRAYTSAGDKDSAATHYQKAAAYPTTYYGQLALARLSRPPVSFTVPPAADAETAARFAARELVQAIQHLTAAGVTNDVRLFYRSLAASLADPQELALLAKLADDNHEFQASLQVGVAAANRTSVAAALAFPTAAIPDTAATPSVERSLVFAIARQESSFNPAAASAAGAFGLLQLLPTTAKEVAQRIGVVYSKDRLTSDTGYNATLGAVHVGALVADYKGSYVLALAAYNAGTTRVTAWIKAYGDPRDPKVDVVDWVERLPFTETRNYIQRVMENLQDYRARLGAAGVSLDTDLKRGKVG